MRDYDIVGVEDGFDLGAGEEMALASVSDGALRDNRIQVDNCVEKNEGSVGYVEIAVLIRHPRGGGAVDQKMM